MNIIRQSLLKDFTISPIQHQQHKANNQRQRQQNNVKQEHKTIRNQQAKLKEHSKGKQN
jgi:hypothetical protein